MPRPYCPVPVRRVEFLYKNWKYMMSTASPLMATAASYWHLQPLWSLTRQEQLVSLASSTESYSAIIAVGDLNHTDTINTLNQWRYAIRKCLHNSFFLPNLKRRAEFGEHTQLVREYENISWINWAWKCDCVGVFKDEALWRGFVSPVISYPVLTE